MIHFQLGAQVTVSVQSQTKSEKKELKKLKSRIDTGAGFRLGLSKIYVVM